MVLKVLILSGALASDGQAVVDWLERHGMQHCVVEARLRHQQTPEDAAAAAKSIAADLRNFDDALLAEQRRAQGELILGDLDLLTAAELELEMMSSTVRRMHQVLWERRLGQPVEYVASSSRYPARRIKTMIRNLQRRRQEVATAPGVGDAGVAMARRDEVVLIDRLVRRAWFLNGWARLLEGLLSEDGLVEDEARESFAQVIELPMHRLSPVHASLDLRSDPLVARSVFGLALVAVANGRPDAALAWMDAEMPLGVPDHVLMEAARWHVMVAAAVGRFDVVLDVLEQVADTDAELCVLAALESCQQSAPEAAQVVSLAVRHLHEQEDLERLRMVARQCPLQGTGARSELAMALAAWDRALQDDGVPAAWLSVAEQLWHATQEARRVGLVTPNALDYQLGWAWRQAGESTQAAAAFLQSVDANFRAEESLALAIDAMAASGSSPSELIELLARSLRQWPTGRWWVRHALQMAELTGSLEPDVEERLLAIPRSDPNRSRVDEAMERLAWRQLLDDPNDVSLLQAYVQVAMPLLMERDQSALIGQWAARIASASLALPSAGLEDAQLALDRAAELAVLDGSVELRCLRARWHAERGELVQATDDMLIAQQLDADHPGIESAWRAILAAVDEDASDEQVQAVVMASKALASRPLTDAVRVAVGQVAALGVTRDPTDLQALALLEEMVSQSEPPAALVVMRAQAATAQGDWTSAAEWWQRASQGVVQQGPAWFEARYEMIRALARVDAALARATIDQHVGLYPDGGPSPWGPRLLDLQKALRQGSLP